MGAAVVLARVLHFAALVSLAGTIAFTMLVAEPAGPLRRRLSLLAWASLALALVSGAAWLALEASSMSGRPLAAVFAQGIIGVVLKRTQFGHDWVVRFLFAAALAPCLIARDRLAAGPRARIAGVLALLLSGAMLAGLAWAGHAGATLGREGDVHLVSDVLHLLAAGAWLGALLPLALLLGEAVHQPALLDSARAATRRFSVLGIISVGTLLLTGIVNSWILVGSIPGLLGTAYGQLLLLKIALFLAMVGVAAVNRQRLTPLLIAAPAPGAPLRALRRNAFIETTLGLAVLAVVGVLGTLPPAQHTQPEWPLSFRLDLDAVPLDRGTALAGVMLALGLLLLLWAALGRRLRWPAALAGLALVAGFGWQALAPALVKAYPTSFYRSPVAYAAPSIARGAETYAAQCALCHGAGGRGDGRAAAGLPKKPADLTAAHLFAHSSGDLFWWISHGIAAGGMPPFADIIDERSRWDVINFLHARAGAVQPAALLPEVTPGPAPLAPDFAFERGGEQQTLHQAIEAGPVLLVLYRLPGSLPRLQQLASAQGRLGAAGLRLLAVPLDARAGEGESAPPIDFAGTTEPATEAGYALFEGAAGPAHAEFLIDRAGYIRARWKAGDGAGLADAPTLLAQLDRLAHLPLQPQQAHVHAH